MQAGSNPEWIRWGEVDPMFGVSSWAGKGAGEAEAWTEEEFFELGRQDWVDFKRRWDAYGRPDGSCVEIGSGAGRITRWMAQDFSEVHGVDVSPGMLRAAAKATEGLPVSLHHVDGLGLPFEDASVDAVFSTHVFQHFDSAEDAAANWAEIARVLRPGGTLMVHLPVHLWPGGLERLQAVYNLRRSAGDLRAAVARRRMVRKGAAPIMRGQCYEWADVESTLDRLGFQDIELVVLRVGSNGGQHSCVLARRS